MGRGREGKQTRWRGRRKEGWEDEIDTYSLLEVVKWLYTFIM